MLPAATLPVPASLMTLLAAFSPLFTAPSFRTFCGPACGYVAQPGIRTVCGCRPVAVVIDDTLLKRSSPDQPTLAEIHALRLAWGNAAA